MASPERDDLRSEARERALALLYEAEAKSLSGPEVLAQLAVPADRLAVLLVEGVDANRAEIDEHLRSAAKGWTLERMPVIDRTVLRMACFELMHRPEVPVAVVLNEAVQLAKDYSTDDSGRFVNGMLATLARKLRAD